MKKRSFILVIILLLSATMFIAGCGEQKSSTPEILAVTILDVSTSRERGSLDDEQVCSICNNGFYIAKEGDTRGKVGEKVDASSTFCPDQKINVKVNLQTKNYKEMFFACRELKNGLQERDGLVVNDGTNNFWLSEPMNQIFDIKYCCSTNIGGYDYSKEKCSEARAVRGTC